MSIPETAKLTYHERARAIVANSVEAQFHGIAAALVAVEREALERAAGWCAGKYQEHPDLPDEIMALRHPR